MSLEIRREPGDIKEIYHEGQDEVLCIVLDDPFLSVGIYDKQNKRQYKAVIGKQEIKELANALLEISKQFEKERN